jgi:hypothetical protein
VELPRYRALRALDLSCLPGMDPWDWEYTLARLNTQFIHLETLRLADNDFSQAGHPSSFHPPGVNQVCFAQ